MMSEGMADETKGTASSLKYIGNSRISAITRLSDPYEHTEQWQAITVVVLILGVLGCGALLPMDDFPDIRASIRYALPLIIFSLVLLLTGWLVAWRKIEEQSALRVLAVDETGITIGAKIIGAKSSIKIAWEQLVAMEVIDESKPNKAQAKNVIYLSASLNDAYASTNLYKLTWENAFSWIEPETFFSEVKANAREAKINFTPSTLSRDEGTRYTNLWLQYFSSPDTRARRGLLPEGSLLDQGRYRVIRKIGAGGQGTIYLAATTASEVKERLSKKDDDPECEVQVVLKEFVLPVHRGSELSARQFNLLNSESEILSQIDHPNIVKLLDCFVEDYRGYIVLEFIDGDTLKALVTRQGKLPEPAVKETALAICRILDYLHEMGIVHRDLTPDNLICDPEGQIKLIDFTVALQLQASRSASIVGKQAYIPPEQFRGRPMPQSDIYSLGCTMYFLLTGVDPEPMQESHPRETLETISVTMDRIVGRATAFDIHDRYHSAEQMKGDLERLS